MSTAVGKIWKNVETWYLQKIFLKVVWEIVNYSIEKVNLSVN